MRTFSLLLVVVVGMGFCLDATAQDFQTVEAKQAEQKYLRALKAARSVYIAELKSAAKQAIKKDNRDEVIRIKEKIGELRSPVNDDRRDAVVQLRRKLKNTTWSFNRPDIPETIRFSAKNGVTRISTKGKSTGVWESLENNVVMAKFNKNRFFFQFDDTVKTFRVRAFGPIKTEYKSGKQISR